MGDKIFQPIARSLFFRKAPSYFSFLLFYFFYSPCQPPLSPLSFSFFPFYSLFFPSLFVFLSSFLSFFQSRCQLSAYYNSTSLIKKKSCILTNYSLFLAYDYRLVYFYHLGMEIFPFFVFIYFQAYFISRSCVEYERKVYLHCRNWKRDYAVSFSWLTQANLGVCYLLKIRK